ncbi:hypothetical protein [Shewanella xiamenensis]|uniref:hypothetical protein n=1 Tax=Shewanella xiamenensis TaxID=332186 RepID=UPI00313ABB23
MALVNCKECSGKVSDKAKVCPHCGNKLRPKTTTFTWIATVMIIAVGIQWVLIVDRKPVSTKPTAKEPAEIYTAPSNPFNANVKNIVSYIDRFNVDAALDFDADINQGQNVVAENELYRVLFETQENKIRFISVDIKRSAPCQFGKRIDKFKDYLLETGFDEALLIRNQSTNSDSFIDQSNGVKVTVICQHSGGSASVNITKL